MTHHFGVKKARFKDPRQFKFHKTFGAFPITSVPDTFDFGTVPVIKDQGATEWCTAFSGSYAEGGAAQEDASPERIAEKTIEYTRANPANFTGTTPQIADKVLVKYGTIPQTSSPYQFGKDDPITITTPSNWASFQPTKTIQKFGASFELTSDGYLDLFDAVRATLFSKKLPIRLAVWFQPAWEFASQGIITKEMTTGFESGINGHSMQADPAIVLKNGVQYLRVPNSWGTGVGDNGYYYFSREAVNLTFYVSAYDPFSDVQAVKGEQWSFWTFLFDELVSTFRWIQKLFK
ncbi:hypothetical protein M1506_00730 [Patescibacteria group bacterium]|nr:hypothetical protein [Patescibacteria group bacterium]